MDNKCYQVIEGVKCFAPSVAFENDGFDRTAFQELYNNESQNFWFVNRNKLIRYLVSRFLCNGHTNSFLEIGCGTGYVLEGLSEIPWLKLTGSEIYLEGLKFARKRNPDIDFIQMDARRIPFLNTFEAVGMFDVLEHIREDELVLTNVYNALTPGGKLFITVPQHQFMWSDIDKISKHQRRYSRSDLTRKLLDAGFENNFCSSFLTILFPFMAVSRLFKQKNANASAELMIPSVINTSFHFLTTVELLLIKIGFRLPFGGSLVCVAVKPNPLQGRHE